MRTPARKTLLLLLLLLLLLPESFISSADKIAAAEAADAALGRPLIIYYSRLGTTRTIARELARNLNSEIEEIISNKNRHGLWTVNCVFDQLFDRDDDVVPLYRDVREYNPVIIAGPIWIHRFASPLSTLLKSLDLRGKDMYVLVTNQGNYSEKDENNVRNSLAERGAVIRGYASIMTKGKSDRDLRQEALSVADDVRRVAPKLKPAATR